jgi:hypothetical protein
VLARKDHDETALTRSATGRLHADFHGQLISPRDDAYGAARRVWDGAIDRYPAENFFHFTSNIPPWVRRETSARRAGPAGKRRRGPRLTAVG